MEHRAGPLTTGISLPQPECSDPPPESCSDASCPMHGEPTGFIFPPAELTEEQVTELVAWWQDKWRDEWGHGQGRWLR